MDTLVSIHGDDGEEDDFSARLCVPSSPGDNSSSCNSSSPSSSDALLDALGKVDHLDGMSDYQYVFILAQLLHGVGAAALVTLGTTLMDESVSKASAPMYIGLFEATFILGPALGY